MRNNLSIYAFLLLAAFAFVLLVVIPPAARITVLDLNGAVLYDSDGATDNHANRVEFQQALQGRPGVVVRQSETTHTELLYSATRLGGHVLRVAVPCEGLLAPLLLARFGFLVAGVLGALTAGMLVRFRHKLDTAQANEAFRREFTANVTHELRTPLTAILGAVETLGDGSALTEEERRELFDIIREQTGRLNALSGDVLALAQLEREQPRKAHAFEPVDLVALMRHVVELETPKARGGGVELVVAAAEPAIVQGDARLLEQALVNLVENALRYSGSDRVELACRAQGRNVELSVVDFGVGIAAQHLPRLFERFYRVDKTRSRALGGTGLGLAIVKHIAQVHGGDVAVASEPGVRTAFTLTFPGAKRFLCKNFSPAY